MLAFFFLNFRCITFSSQNTDFFRTQAGLQIGYGDPSEIISLSVCSSSWGFIMLLIPPVHLAISCQNSLLAMTHTTPASGNCVEELWYKWARNKVGAKWWVLCSPFLTCYICMSSTCRLRGYCSVASDGQPKVIRKLALKMYFLLSVAFGSDCASTQEPSKPTGPHEICVPAYKLLLCSSCTLQERTGPPTSLSWTCGEMP